MKIDRPRERKLARNVDQDAVMWGRCEIRVQELFRNIGISLRRLYSRVDVDDTDDSTHLRRTYSNRSAAKIERKA